MEFDIERQTKALMVMMTVFEGFTVAEIISCLCAFIEALGKATENEPQFIAKKILKAIEKHHGTQQS